MIKQAIERVSEATADCIYDLSNIAVTMLSDRTNGLKLFEERMDVHLLKVYNSINELYKNDEIRILVRIYHFQAAMMTWDSKNVDNKWSQVTSDNSKYTWLSILFGLTETSERTLPGFILHSSDIESENIDIDLNKYCCEKDLSDCIDVCKQLNNHIWGDARTLPPRDINTVANTILKEIDSSSFMHIFLNDKKYNGRHIYTTTTVRSSNKNERIEIIHNAIIKEIAKLTLAIGGIVALLSRSEFSREIEKNIISYENYGSRALWKEINDNILASASNYNWVPISQTEHIQKVWNRLYNKSYVASGERNICQIIYDELIHTAGVLPVKFLKVSKYMVVQESLSKIIAHALDFEETMKSIPNYRQHFIHSFHVFLLGLLIIGITGKENYKDNRHDSDKMLYGMWFIASMYHDVAYTAAKVEQWVAKYFEKIMFEKKDNGSIKVSKELAHILRYETYHYQLREIYRIVRDRISLKRKMKDATIVRLENKILESLILDSDHGVLGSLMIRKALCKLSEKNQSCDTVIDAIMWHDGLWRKEEIKDIAFVNRPAISRLLIICDTIQEWGRPMSDSEKDMWNTVLMEAGVIDEKEREIRFSLEYTLKKGRNREDAVEWMRDTWGKVICDRFGILEEKCEVPGEYDIVISYIFRDMIDEKPYYYDMTDKEMKKILRFKREKVSVTNHV